MGIYAFDSFGSTQQSIRTPRLTIRCEYPVVAPTAGPKRVQKKACLQWNLCHMFVVAAYSPAANPPDDDEKEKRGVPQRPCFLGDRHAKRFNERRKEHEESRYYTGTSCPDDGQVPSCGGPGMGDDLEVKVLPEPGRRDRREAQGVRREAYAERSVKRTRESTNRNRIRGAADRGERTTDREAPATKGKRRRSGDCAGKVIVLTRGGLA